MKHRTEPKIVVKFYVHTPRQHRQYLIRKTALFLASHGLAAGLVVAVLMVTA